MGCPGWGHAPVPVSGGLSLASHLIIDVLFLMPFPSPQHSFWIILHVFLEKGEAFSAGMLEFA